MEMQIRPGVFSIAALLVLFSGGIAAAQELQKGVTYVCDGERMFIENCNIRDLSDTATCMVGHPDTVLPNGLMKYTYETRGALKKLFPTCKQPSADQVARAQAFEKKQNDLYEANVKKANEENDAIEARAQAVITGKKPQTAEQRALNRCITSGRLPATCMGNTLMKPFGDIVASVLPEVGKELPSGSHFSGNFEGNGSWRIEFDDRFSMTTCGGLDPAQEKYSLVLKNNSAVITIPSKPKDIFLTMRPDGTLVGPGPITVYGIITTGQRTEETSTTRTHVTEYKDATRVCPPPVLSSKGAAPSAVDMGTGFLKSMFSDGEKGPPTPPGLRMHGTYGGQGGIGVEFYPESAVVGCGEAAHASPYVVQVSGTQPVIKIEDPGHPIVLTMKPDGELDSGSGLYEVHGRTITGKNDNGDFTFAPLNATCNLGPLKPGAAPAAPPAVTTTASAPGAPPSAGGPVISMPNAPLGNAVLTIVSGFPAQPNVLNPLAAYPYTLLRESFANALAKGGIPVPPGTAPFKVLAMACQNRTPDCQRILQVWKSDAISAARADITGKAILPGVPPGTYYLMLSTRYNNQPISWDMKVELKAGANSVTLDQRNAAPVN
jgi:hypothetical protein